MNFFTVETVIRQASFLKEKVRPGGKDMDGKVLPAHEISIG